MKLIQFLTISTILLICYNYINAQNIIVISESTREPIHNAALHNKEKNLATLTNEEGIANISIFKENDSIFFQHPSYNQVVFTKKELCSMKKVVLSKKIILIDEFVISASKSKENKKDIAYQVDVLKPPQLKENAAETAADILLSSGNLIIQKTQGGGGSPILRGFEANRVLLVVDGVRMNNAIYRSGHLQNSITLDNSILERIEVTFGPNSLIYGSDALGGVIHYYTAEPELNEKEKGNNFNVNALIRYSTANNGKVNHININNGFKKLGFLTSISYKDLGDIRMGDYKNPFYGDFGEVKHYVGQVDRRDTTLVNPDPHLQLNTGYSQIDVMQKVKYAPSKILDLILNVQYSTSSEIDRLDKLNDYKGDNLKYAEYYYGPQNRFLASAKSVLKKDIPLFTNMTTILAFQNIDEDRITRKFNDDSRMYQEEDLNILSLTVDFLKLRPSKNRLNYGLEFSYNDARSNAWYEDILSFGKSPAETRYPDGGSHAWVYSAYSSYKWFVHPKVVLAGGMRYHYGIYKSDFLPGGILPYDKIEINNGAITGSLNLVYKPEKSWKISAIASSGFRNPNIDDYGKVRAKDNMVTVPNPDLKSEYTYNLELGISKTLEGYIQLNATGFYTFLTDAIVRTDYQLNGSDSLEYDGDMYKIITNSNASNAYIRGLSLNVISDLNSNLSFRSTLNFTQGRNTSDDVPLGHIPPIFGRTSVRYDIKNIVTELFFDYNGWKDINQMSPYEEDNDAEATEYGWPGWYTVNFRTTYQISKMFRFQVSIENIFDSFYKPFASGVAAPGRNFIFSIRANIN